MSFWDTVVGKLIKPNEGAGIGALVGGAFGLDPLTGAVLGNIGGSPYGQAVLDPATAIEDQIRNQPDVTGTTANGGVLDTAQSDEDRQRQMALIAQLQQQAMSGDPVALAQLQAGTQKTVAGLSAIGQTSAAQHGVDPSTALRNILDAQAHEQQVGVGQADVAKALQQQQAQQQLAGIMGGVRGQDIGQAQGQQTAQVGMQEANTAGAEQRDKLAQNTGKAMLSTIPYAGGALSKSQGGPIGGRALVPGDNEANDIVPAMLSPGEIVIPRSHAGSPEAAAAFVAALQAHQRAQHFAEGGGVQIPVQGGTGHGLEDFGAHLANTFLRTEGLGPHQIVPYTPLQTGPADAMRGQMGGLSDQLAAAAAGNGPSAVGGQLQAATDRNLQAAMAASARGQNPLGAMGDEQQRLAGESAMARAGETEQARQTNAALSAQMRGQSLQQAQIAQKAALETTLINMGLDAAHRAAVMNTIGAIGQGAAAAGASGIFSRSRPDAAPDYMKDPTTPEALSALSDNPYPSEQPGRGSASDLSNGEGKAHGGIIEDPRFATIKGRDGKPMKVARSGVSPAFLQRFAEGGPVLSPEQQDALTSHLTGPSSPLASFQPARPPLTAADWGPVPGAQTVAPAQPRPTLSPSDFAPAPGAPVWTPGQGLSTPKPAGRVVEQWDPKAGKFAKVELPTEEAPMYRGEPGLFRAPAPAKEAATKTPLYAPPSSPAPSRAAQMPAGGGPGATPISRTAPDANQAAITAGTKAEQAAIEAEGKAEGERNRQLADAAAQREADATAAAARQAALASDYQAHRQAAQDKFESLTQKYSDMTVDPSRFWGNRTTGDKVLAGIGLALGALGGSADGVNRSVGIIQQAIDRDIDAQKANIAKAGEVAGRQGQLLGIMRSNFGDDAQALAATEATHLRAAQAKVESVMAMTADPIKKAQLAQVGQALGVKQAEADRTFAAQQDAHSKEFALRQSELGLRRDMLSARLAGRGGSLADVPEVKNAARNYVQGGGGTPGKTPDLELAMALARASGANGRSAPRIVNDYLDKLSGWRTLTEGQRADRVEAMMRAASVPGVISSGGGGDGGEAE